MSREHLSHETAMFPSSAVQHLAYTNVKNVGFEHSIFKWVDLCAVSKWMEMSNVFCKETPVLNEAVLKGCPDHVSLKIKQLFHILSGGKLHET